MENFIDILQTVAVGVFVNLITPRVRKWLGKLRKEWQQ